MGAPIPDELCPHVEIGAQMVGGFVFAAEQPEVKVGMCQECLDRCRFVFDNPQPLNAPERGRGERIFEPKE